MKITMKQVDLPFRCRSVATSPWTKGASDYCRRCCNHAEDVDHDVVSTSGDDWLEPIWLLLSISH